MPFNLTTHITIALVAFGAIASAPVLYKGFRRRGKGVKYEHNFLIQRAPQFASVLNIVVIVLSYLAFNHLLFGRHVADYLTAVDSLPQAVGNLISWLGIALFISGLIFMIGGWYSLGDCFTTDAEVLNEHTIRSTGLLKLVMHPAYSGIVQSLVGASIVCLSMPSILITLAIVAPLWLRRAKYEEKLLLETFGESYKDYANRLNWRRLVPNFIPIGL